MIAWVVGASGKIGSAVCRQLSSQGLQVVGIGRTENRDFSYGQWTVWNPAEGSHTQLPLISPDVVFFLSGQTSASRARSDVAGDIRANTVALINVVEAAIYRGNQPHIVSAGSITESCLDIDGLSAFKSISAIAGFYETGKAVQRLYLSQYARESLIDFTVLRLSNVYGGTNTQVIDRGFLDHSIKSAVHSQRLVYYKGADFKRDYIHVNDVAKAFVSVALKRDATRNKTYDIGSEKSVPIKDVMLLLQRLVEINTNRKVALDAILPPENLHPVEREDRYVDSGEFKRATAWRCSTDLSTGLQLAINMWGQISV